MDTGTVTLSAVSAFLGGLLSILAKFVIDYFTMKKKADHAHVQALFLAAKEERDALNVRQHQIMTDLQRQIFDMRQEVIKLQQDNINCAKENAELRARVTVLTEVNNELHVRITDLETELSALRQSSVSTAQPKV